MLILRQKTRLGKRGNNRVFNTIECTVERGLPFLSCERPIMENYLGKDRLRKHPSLKMAFRQLMVQMEQNSWEAVTNHLKCSHFPLEALWKSFSSSSNAKRKTVNETIPNVFWYCKHMHYIQTLRITYLLHRPIRSPPITCGKSSG